MTEYDYIKPEPSNSWTGKTYSLGKGPPTNAEWHLAEAIAIADRLKTLGISDLDAYNTIGDCQEELDEIIHHIRVAWDRIPSWPSMHQNLLRDLEENWEEGWEEEGMPDSPQTISPLEVGPQALVIFVDSLSADAQSADCSPQTEAPQDQPDCPQPAESSCISQESD